MASDLPGKPNVLWIMTDQHRADCLGCMGHPVIQTPYLDALAEEGVLFESAFCQSPVCMASRGVLFTGRYPEAIRIRGMGILPPSETTFPEMLKRHGYHTAAFGKVHLTPEQHTRAQLQSDRPVLDWRRFAADACISPIPDDPCKQNYGFDIHVGCDDANQGHFHRWLAEHAPHLAVLKPQPTDDGPGDLFVSPYPSRYHQSTFIADSCIDFIRRRNEGQPWFAFCSFVAPHHPFEAPADQIDRYNMGNIPLPACKGGVDPAFIPPPMADAVDEIHGFQASCQTSGCRVGGAGQGFATFFPGHGDFHSRTGRLDALRNRRTGPRLGLPLGGSISRHRFSLRSRRVGLRLCDSP